MDPASPWEKRGKDVRRVKASPGKREGTRAPIKAGSVLPAARAWRISPGTGTFSTTEGKKSSRRGGSITPTHRRLGEGKEDWMPITVAKRRAGSLGGQDQAILYAMKNASVSPENACLVRRELKKKRNGLLQTTGRGERK